MCSCVDCGAAYSLSHSCGTNSLFCLHAVDARLTYVIRTYLLQEFVETVLFLKFYFDPVGDALILGRNMGHQHTLQRDELYFSSIDEIIENLIFLN